MTTDNDTTFRIPAENWDSLVAKVEKIAKRANKLIEKGDLRDATPIRLVQCGIDIIESPQGDEPDEIYIIAKVEGSAPTLAGWDFLATLQHEEAGVILRTVPTARIEKGELDNYRTASPNDCDHCHTRRRRNDTYVVRNVETGELKQVGRSCLKDFCGGKDPKNALRFAQWLRDIEEECSGGYGGGHAQLVASRKQFLSLTATAIRVYGWVSRSQARNVGDDECAPTLATADRVWNALFPFGKYQVEAARWLFAEVLPEDAEKAEKALADFAANAGHSDYEHNLMVALASETITHRTAGLAASVLSWHARRVEKALREEIAKKQRAASAHVGTVGKREDFSDLTLASVYDAETQFGWLHIHRFLDSEGNVLIWKTASKRLEQGTVYALKATVKEHSEYRGTKQTVLTRCKVL